MKPNDCCILNSGGGSWAFAPLARQLSDALWVDVSQASRRFNYLLLADDGVAEARDDFFIPFPAMQLAADKRLVASAFAAHGVPTPRTLLLESMEDAERLLVAEPDRKWCLKFPTGCGASGHRFLTSGMRLPEGWPLPLVVQEFIRRRAEQESGPRQESGRAVHASQARPLNCKMRVPSPRRWRCP
jgi:hypothetical protein